MDSSTFPNVARLFARSLRELDALRRLAASRAKFVFGSEQVGATLDDARRSIAEHDWVLSVPLEDEYWDRAATFEAARDFSAMYAALTQLGTSIIRTSRWLQGESVRIRPEDLPSPEFPVPYDAKQKSINAARLGKAMFASALTIGGTGPTRVIVALSDRCNYRCRTCYQSASQEFAQFDLSSSNLERLSEAFRFALTVSVAGFGEPLLSPAAPHVLAAAKASGAVTSITTNGSLLSRLARVPLDRIELSFDGASAMVLETIRSGAKLGVIVSNLLALPDSQRAKTAFNVVVNKLNVNEVAAIVAQARSLGVGEVCLQSFSAYLPWHDDMRLTAADLTVLDAQVALGRAQAGPVRVRDMVVRNANPRSTSVPADQVLETLRTMADPKSPHGDEETSLAELKEALSAITLDPADFFPALAAFRKPISTYFHSRTAGVPAAPRLPYCLEPFSSVVVNSDGSTNPCCKLTWNMGNINDQPIETIWNGAAYQTLRSALITRRGMPLECQNCRDTARWSNLPVLLDAMYREDGHVAPVAPPDDWELPPSLADSPQVRVLFSNGSTPQPPAAIKHSVDRSETKVSDPV